MRSRLRIPSPAILVASAALFVSLGGGAYAATGLIHGDQLANNTITHNKLSSNVIWHPQLGSQAVQCGNLTKDIQAALTPCGGTQHAAPVAGANGTNGATGAAGPKGDAGATGATGPQGPAGDSYMAGAYYAVAYYDVGDTNGGAIATVACQSQNDTAISGGVSVSDYTKNVPVGQSFPGRMDWSTNTPLPNRLDGWVVQFASQNSSAPEKVKVYALCDPGLNVPVVNTYTESNSN